VEVRWEFERANRLIIGVADNLQGSGLKVDRIANAREQGEKVRLDRRLPEGNMPLLRIFTVTVCASSRTVARPCLISGSRNCLIFCDCGGGAAPGQRERASRGRSEAWR